MIIIVGRDGWEKGCLEAVLVVGYIVGAISLEMGLFLASVQLLVAAGSSWSS